MDVTRAINGSEGGHLLSAYSAHIRAATAASATALWTRTALPTPITLVGGAEELFIGLDKARQRFLRKRREEAVTPTVERR